MLQSLRLIGYRSLRDFRLALGQVTVVTGENGVGKSNLYRALALVQSLATGRFAAAIAAEGGFPSVLWAGQRLKTEARRLCWELDHIDFHFRMECGMIPTTPGDPTMFKTDPDIKVEELRHGGKRGRIMARRKGPSIELRRSDGAMFTQPLPVHLTESILTEVREAGEYPSLLAARETLQAWRFYHHFPTGPDSPLRRPVTGFWSPVLRDDGANLAATLQTICESGFESDLNQAVESAFPGCSWSPVEKLGKFQLHLQRTGIQRALSAAELSDGTLRFLCLCAALLTPKPPPFLVLNEPESSLHADLLPALADLIAQAAKQTQILIVTHSRDLATQIADRTPSKTIDLTLQDGETREKQTVAGGARRVWKFEEEE